MLCSQYGKHIDKFLPGHSSTYLILSTKKGLKVNLPGKNVTESTLMELNSFSLCKRMRSVLPFISHFGILILLLTNVSGKVVTKFS